jgi:hypothetical protein
MPEIAVRPRPSPALPPAVDGAFALMLRLLAQQRSRPDTFLARAVPALVAEGRRFAGTPAGRVWRERLAGAPLVANGAELWRAFGLDALLDGLDAGVAEGLPSDRLEELLQELAEARIEGIVAALDAIALDMAARHG